MTTIDLELAKELQSVCNEKGIKMPNSEDVWAKKRYHTSPYIIYGEEGVYPKCLIHTTDAYAILAPAYTLDELLEILPKSIKNKYRLCLTTNNYKEYMIYYEKHTNAIRYGTNPANAACKLLIWLIKEGLI